MTLTYEVGWRGWVQPISIVLLKLPYVLQVSKKSVSSLFFSRKSIYKGYCNAKSLPHGCSTAPLTLINLIGLIVCINCQLVLLLSLICCSYNAKHHGHKMLTAPYSCLIDIRWAVGGCKTPAQTTYFYSPPSPWLQCERGLTAAEGDKAWEKMLIKCQKI